MMRSINVYLTAVLLTGGFVTDPSVPLVLAGEPQAQTPSSSSGSEVGASEPASPGTAPTPPDEAVPPGESSDIQDRGVLPGRLAPGHVMPGAALQFIAPTPSLTAIRNALKVTSKSISVNLRIPPNLPVTVPVEVSVAYISPVQTRRVTKTYNSVTGLTMVYREAEGDGKPRTMGMDITVRELIPNGQSFSVSKQFTVTPLYQATISPLRFNMATKCDTVGKSDITLQWIYFNGRRGEQQFDLGFGQTKMVNHFNSGRREFSTEDNLKEPVMQFFERDFALARYTPPIDQPTVPLVPGPSKEFSFFLDDEVTGPPARQHSGSTKCKAHISYRIDRGVMAFDQF